MKPLKPWSLALIAIVILLIGFGVGWFVNEKQQTSSRSIRELASDYQFIAPLLFVETPEEQAFPEYSNLKEELTSYVRKVENEGEVGQVSVYFRNLNTSQWIAVSPEEKYAPASMLKVALLMAVLRAAEQDPQLLSKKVIASGVEVITEKQQKYAPAEPMESGRTYKVEDLLTKLIVHSDNGANHTLHRILGDEEQVMKIYDDLKMHRPEENDPGYTAAEYSRLFRTLYNGTYLSRPQSEYALKLLSQAVFTQGLVAGVPEGIVVAHKFGVGTVTDSRGIAQRELHDCGIVYYPEHPYFLCVMTRGSDFSVLERVIAEASRLTWEEVSAIH